MYESYSRQALPSKNYRELLGAAICVFNSNNSFVIENILRNDAKSRYDWWTLIDMTSGDLSLPIKKTITKASNTQIATLFGDLINKRNRIVHSFQITDCDNEQRLATKDKRHHQFVITEDYLLEFIRGNEKLSTMLHEFRGC